MAEILEAHARLQPLPETGGDPARPPFLPGDVAELTLHATTDGQGTLRWPTGEELTAALKDVAAQDDGRDAAADPGVAGGTAWARSYRVQVLAAPGGHELGPVPLVLEDGQGNELARFEVPPLALSVASVLEAAEAETLAQATPDALPAAVAQMLAPARGPWAVSSPLPLLPLLLALLAAAVAGAAFAWWRRRRRPAAAAPAAPPEAPEVLARRRLEALLAAGHLESGRHLAFHVELADILKSYLGQRYDADFLDRTTDEVRWALLRDLRDRPGVGLVRAEVVEVLTACDLVKFARHLPRPDEALAGAHAVRRIVDRTTPAAAPGVAARDGMREGPREGAA